jgi:DNA-binding NarL/FixJ family response regulator
MTGCTAPAQRPLRMLLADDHEVVRVAVRHTLSSLAPSIDWREAADAAAAEAELERCDELDLALLDLHMPGARPLEWIAKLRARHPSLPLVVLSGDEEPSLVRTLIGYGIAGFIPKSDSALILLQAVRLVLSGGTYAPLRLVSGSPTRAADAPPQSASKAVAGLTSRQRDVLRLLALGYPNKRIARALDVSEATVKVHVLAILRALGVRNRTEAVVAAQKDSGLTAREPKRPECQGDIP